MGDCITCGMFNQFDQLAQGYGRDAFGVIAPAARLVFNAYVGVWVAWVLIYNAMIRGDLNIQMVVPRIMTIALCDVALNGVDLYWDWLYQPAYDAMNQLATALVVKSSTGIDVRTLAGMLGEVEHRILQVLGICKTMWDDGGLTALGLIIAAAILALPYVFVWGIFMAFVLEGVFKLLAITAIAPLLIVAAGFPATRGFAISGARVVLGGILTVVFHSLRARHLLDDSSCRRERHQRRYQRLGAIPQLLVCLHPRVRLRPLPSQGRHPRREHLRRERRAGRRSRRRRGGHVCRGGRQEHRHESRQQGTEPRGGRGRRTRPREP
ncbi:MAG: hypothetical protein JWL84_1273 [Rhodospirillales bacterium]|nr:hypothetical protein [Rhodospirillales bacterium]